MKDYKISQYDKALKEQIDIIKTVTNNFAEKLYYTKLKTETHKKGKIIKQKKRLLEIPIDEIKEPLQEICSIFQQIPCPKYNFAGYKGKSAYHNACEHVGNFTFVTLDIKDFYHNSDVKFVLKFLKEDLCISDTNLNDLIRILTYNKHIPTGSPTSTILAFLTHKNLFDEVHEYAKSLNIKFTLYADDITLSAQHGITRKDIKKIEKIFAKHNLHLNHKKTTFYNYKKALITGYYLHQSGKISVPDYIGHSVIQILEKQNISEMSKSQLNELIGKINHIQYVDKKAFRIVKQKACKRVSKLTKEENERKNRIN